MAKIFYPMRHFPSQHQLLVQRFLELLSGAVGFKRESDKCRKFRDDADMLSIEVSILV